VIWLNRKLIYLTSFLILTLFLVSACQYKKPIGAPIGNNEETDENLASACRRGCMYSDDRCQRRCETSLCRDACTETYYGWGYIKD